MISGNFLWSGAAATSLESQGTEEGGKSPAEESDLETNP